MPTLFRGWFTFVAIAIAAAAIDIGTKSWAFMSLGMPGEQPGIALVPKILLLETNLNEGALFGIGQGMGWFFATVSLIAIAGILALVSRPATRNDPGLVMALALITGGILGNLFDRLGFPHLKWHAPIDRVGTDVLAVRDWIHFKLDGIIDWPIFNLADSWLMIGAGVLLLLSLRPQPIPENTGAQKAGRNTLGKADPQRTEQTP